MIIAHCAIPQELQMDLRSVPRAEERKIIRLADYRRDVSPRDDEHRTTPNLGRRFGGGECDCRFDTRDRCYDDDPLPQGPPPKPPPPPPNPGRPHPQPVLRGPHPGPRQPHPPPRHAT